LGVAAVLFFTLVGGNQIVRRILFPLKVVKTF